jgi:hypothetical protein
MGSRTLVQNCHSPNFLAQGSDRRRKVIEAFEGPFPRDCTAQSARPPGIQLQEPVGVGGARMSQAWDLGSCGLKWVAPPAG